MSYLSNLTQRGVICNLNNGWQVQVRKLDLALIHRNICWKHPSVESMMKDLCLLFDKDCGDTLMKMINIIVGSLVSITKKTPLLYLPSDPTSDTKKLGKEIDDNFGTSYVTQFPPQIYHDVVSLGIDTEI